ncbi:hypothetical protein [Pseudomonas sp. PL-6]
MTDQKLSKRELFADIRRDEVRWQAERLGLAITRLPGGYRLLGQHIHLWVTDLQYVTDQDLSFR